MGRLPLGVVVAAVVWSGCARDHEFVCDDDSQCIVDNQIGACQPSGGCSFEDDSCASGQRYGEFANDTLADDCVPQAIDLLSTSLNDQYTLLPGGDRLLVVFAFVGQGDTPEAVTVRYGGVDLIPIAGASVTFTPDLASMLQFDLEMSGFYADEEMLGAAADDRLVVEPQLGTQSTLSAVFAGVEQSDPFAEVDSGLSPSTGGVASTSELTTFDGGRVVLSAAAVGPGMHAAGEGFDEHRSRFDTPVSRILATRPGTNELLSASATFVPDPDNTSVVHSVLGVSLRPGPQP